MKQLNVLKTFLSCALIATTMLTVQAQKPKMVTQKLVLKMTMPIPVNITTPDKIQSPIGTMEFFDGVPNRKTISHLLALIA